MTARRSTLSRTGDLSARVVARIPLRYSAGADEQSDRPAHVRAASALAWMGERIALVQDDVAIVAVIDPGTHAVHAIALPAGASGARQFDDRRGNKKLKLDLEACVAVPGEDGPMLLAIGSGAKPRREGVVLMEALQLDTPRISVVPLPRFYEALRGTTQFAGSEMNIEGAVLVGDRIRLFGRGNGAPRGALLPLNASCDVPWDALLAHIRAPATTALPPIERVAQYELGALGGVTLGFTDAAVLDGSILFAAAAEASLSAVLDGKVTGSAIGRIDASGTGGWTELVHSSGESFVGKIEGILPSRERSDLLHAVVDSDDPDMPSELCMIELRGAWGSDVARAGTHAAPAQ